MIRRAFYPVVMGEHYGFGAYVDLTIPKRKKDESIDDDIPVITNRKNQDDDIIGEFAPIIGCEMPATRHTKTRGDVIYPTILRRLGF